MKTTDNATRTPVIDEGKEFVETLMSSRPSRLTACQGWTVHEITAHLAAGSQEIADLIESHLAGDAPRATRPFDEREAPFRAMDDRQLRSLLFEQVERAKRARDRLSAQTEGVVLFTGRPMHAAEFVTHSRSERALHRWDIVGRDEVGWDMLAQPELTVHAIAILTEMPVLAETFENRLRTAKHPFEDFLIVLRSEPYDDVIVSRVNGVLDVRTESLHDRRVDAFLEPAARLLALWGRREPSAEIRLRDGANRDALWSLFGW